MKNVFLAILTATVTATLSVAGITASASADEIGYGINVGGIEITSDNLTIDDSDSESGVTSGSVVYDDNAKTLTLTDAVVAPEGKAALHIEPGVSVKIILKGESTLTGDDGCAGIFVESGWDDADGSFSKSKSANVTISGDGKLTAIGGDAVHDEFGAGAGIGGNGFGIDEYFKTGGDFGCIVIDDGTIIARGGDDALVPNGSGSNYGSGAGIGGGGVIGNNYSFSWTYCGDIKINSGNITAIGGNGYVGAAGIGTGSAGSSDGTMTDFEIEISGGTVNANGGTDAAGIGGSSNGASGLITISGGTVMAIGGDEGPDSTYGGAGIGGGDNGESDDIVINGNANVTATAGGSAAGIGGGNGGYLKNITISGAANVKAYGGTGYSKSNGKYVGGAAIGSGYQGSFGVPEKTGRITINTTGNIVAYGGADAMSIGTGTNPKSNYYFEVGPKTGAILMFNADASKPAYIDDPAYLTDFKATLTAQYALPEGVSFPAAGTINDAVTIPDGVDIDWTYADSKIRLIRDGETLLEYEYECDTLSNWAAIIPQVDMYVTYTWDGDIPTGSYEQTLPERIKVLHGDTHTVNTAFTSDTVIDKVVDGLKIGQWTFSGWDKTGTITIEDSVTIKGTWSYEAYLAVEFEKTVDENGNPVEKRDERIYDINIVDFSGNNINRFNSAELTFALNQINGKTAYEIIDIKGDNIAANYVEGDKYEFHFETKTDVTNDTAPSITVARVKFTGYGRFEFCVDASVDDNAVHSTEKADNIVDSFAPGGMLDGKKVGTLIIVDKIEEEILAPTQKLTVVVSFPNNVENNNADYQKMKLTVSGDDVSEITVNLGSDNDGEKLKLAYKPDARYTVSFDEKTCKYTVEFIGTLTANRSYTVYVSGDGYRTARYTVNMQETDKTLNFWNNVKDNKLELETGKITSAVKKNFLAGDIVKDNDINIYDLSAVVSYFGLENLSEDYPEYAKYDLNRDNTIDSRDVAYVLVSWGE